jgi:hypothetical protein
MADFPLLKTGSVMQYPAASAIRYSTQTLKFVDGSEQRYRDFPAPLREWVIRLDLLDETELKGLEQFFLDQQGQFGSFEFTDPADDTVYPDCSLMIDDLNLTVSGERRGRTAMVVRENRD